MALPVRNSMGQCQVMKYVFINRLYDGEKHNEEEIRTRYKIDPYSAFC